MNRLDPFNMTILNQTVEDIDIISKFSEYYKDEKFPANTSSLIQKDDGDKNSFNEKLWKTFEWKKLGNISSKLFLLENGVSPFDCIQGNIGNCYLISACSALAEYPKRIKDIFINKEFNKAGIYAVEFYVDGFKKKIIVDDFVPIQDKDSLVFAKIPKSNRIWCIIIEKALAKQKKSYANTISGFPSSVFTILTGAPSHNIALKDIKKEYLENILLQNFHMSYTMCAATQISSSMNKELGLAEGHAYSIVFACKIDISGKEIFLVKLRNPWGYVKESNSKNSKFEGEIIKNTYSDNPLFKQICEFSEGTFVLTLNEFIKCFERIYLCKYIDNYLVHSHYICRYDDISTKSLHSCYKFVIKSKSYTLIKEKIFFSINKPTAFQFSTNNSYKEDNIYCSIFLGKLKDDKYEFIAKAESFSNINTIELDSYETNTSYVILAYINEHSGKIISKYHRGSISIYTKENQVELNEEYDLDVGYVFNSLVYSYYNKFRNLYTENIKKLKHDKITCNSFNFEDSCYGVVIFENLSDKNLLNLNLKYEKNNPKEDNKIILEEKWSQNVNSINTILLPKEYIVISRYRTGLSYTYTYSVEETKMIKFKNEDLIKKKSNEIKIDKSNQNQRSKSVFKEVEIKRDLNVIDSDIKVTPNTIDKYALSVKKSVDKSLNGFTITFSNPIPNVFLEYTVEVKEIENLICDNLDYSNKMVIILEPKGEKCFFFYKIEHNIKDKFQLSVNAKKYE